ncbi:hypothetical protein [Methanosarcina barkeri]|uniref:hypothetical protein n=1 Tax=Methanosarcina barkeri TaxID=2208 RepID=UPI0024372623|nr:hypothetical protein [Methanosarcina barkeri]
MTTEYGGPGFATIEIAHFYEYVFLTGLIFLFWASASNRCAYRYHCLLACNCYR